LRGEEKEPAEEGPNASGINAKKPLSMNTLRKKTGVCPRPFAPIQWPLRPGRGDRKRGRGEFGNVRNSMGKPPARSHTGGLTPPRGGGLRGTSSGGGGNGGGGGAKPRGCFGKAGQAMDPGGAPEGGGAQGGGARPGRQPIFSAKAGTFPR